MTRRSSHSSVTFCNPFNLVDLDEVFPAGVYAVETEEELLENLSFTAYRRVNTTIELQPISSTDTIKRTMSIDPGEIDAALSRDKKLSESRISIDLNATPEVVGDAQ